MKIAEISYNSDSEHKKNEYCYIVKNILSSIEVGIQVVVESNQGVFIANVVSILEIKESDLPIISSTIIKKVGTKEKNQLKLNQKESELALVFAQQQSNKLQLDMHFVDSFYTFDKKQLFLTYVADNRVDFRELAKILAQKYKTRIELRQIGVRDKAKKVGGLGPCGLFLCCNSFLTDFVSVSINMAKNQFLALNPTKINGLCGRLLCCLNYEDEAYTELKKGMPMIGSIVETEKGLGKVISIDIFHRTYKIETNGKEIIELEV